MTDLVTLDGKRGYEADDDGRQLSFDELLAYFGCDLSTPVDETKAHGYERWKRIREEHENEFFKQQFAHKENR